VLLLLVATDGAPELSEVNYTCDYCCCSLLPFFSVSCCCCWLSPRSCSRVFDKKHLWLLLVITLLSPFSHCRAGFHRWSSTVVIAVSCHPEAVREFSIKNPGNHAVLAFFSLSCCCAGCHRSSSTVVIAVGCHPKAVRELSIKKNLGLLLVITLLSPFSQCRAVAREL
jgi:hypothetical protein